MESLQGELYKVRSLLEKIQTRGYVYQWTTDTWERFVELRNKEKMIHQQLIRNLH